MDYAKGSDDCEGYHREVVREAPAVFKGMNRSKSILANSFSCSVANLANPLSFSAYALNRSNLFLFHLKYPNKPEGALSQSMLTVLPDNLKRFRQGHVGKSSRKKTFIEINLPTT